MPHHAVKEAGHAQLVMVTVLVRSDRLSHGPRPLPARPATPQYPLTRRPGWDCGGCEGWPVTRPLCHLHSSLGQNEDLAWPGIISPSSLLYIGRIRSVLGPPWLQVHGKCEYCEGFTYTPIGQAVEFGCPVALHTLLLAT